MFHSVAEIIGHPEYEAFHAHHLDCEVCQAALRLDELPSPDQAIEPPWSGSVFAGFIAAGMCAEGFALAKACLVLDLAPGEVAAIPFTLNGGMEPLVRLAPGDGEVLLKTLPINWATVRVVGFRCRLYTEDLLATALVTDFQIGGSVNLFWHEHWLDARSYGPNGQILLLRDNPILRSPNHAMVQVRHSGQERLGRPVWIGAELLVKLILQDDFILGINEIAHAEMPSAAFVRRLGQLERTLSVPPAEARPTGVYVTLPQHPSGRDWVATDTPEVDFADLTLVGCLPKLMEDLHGLDLGAGITAGMILGDEVMGLALLEREGPRAGSSQGIWLVSHGGTRLEILLPPGEPFEDGIRAFKRTEVKQLFGRHLGPYVSVVIKAAEDKL